SADPSSGGAAHSGRLRRRAAGPCPIAGRAPDQESVMNLSSDHNCGCARRARSRFAASATGLVVPLTIPPLHGLAQSQPNTLAPIVVSGEQPLNLDKPAQTGSNLDLTPRETPASLDIIDRRQIETRGQASVTEAITRATGISAMGHPGNGGSSLSSRGFTDSTSVMRLYDGLRQYGGVGVTFPFDTWSVERIEV